jgi:hypothetical protein
VRAIRAQEFEVATRSPRPVNADGEIVTQTPARFRIHPRAVTVFAPQEGPSSCRGALPEEVRERVEARTGAVGDLRYPEKSLV